MLLSVIMSRHIPRQAGHLIIHCTYPMLYLDSKFDGPRFNNHRTNAVWSYIGTFCTNNHLSVGSHQEADANDRNCRHLGQRSGSRHVGRIQIQNSLDRSSNSITTSRSSPVDGIHHERAVSRARDERIFQGRINELVQGTHCIFHKFHGL